MTGRICEGCPFVRDCPDCIFRGGQQPPTTDTDDKED